MNDWGVLINRPRKDYGTYNNPPSLLETIWEHKKTPELHTPSYSLPVLSSCLCCYMRRQPDFVHGQHAPRPAGGWVGGSICTGLLYICSWQSPYRPWHGYLWRQLQCAQLDVRNGIQMQGENKYHAETHDIPVKEGKTSRQINTRGAKVSMTKMTIKVRSSVW